MIEKVGAFLVLIAAVVAIIFFASGKKTEVVAKKLDISEVVSMGGTCFKSEFTDETGEVENPNADLQKVALGVKDNFLVVQADLAGNLLLDKNHNIKFYLARWFGQELVLPYLDAGWNPTENWSQALYPTMSQYEKIIPVKVETAGKSLRAYYPLDLLLTKGRLTKQNNKLLLNGITFTLLVVEKDTGKTFTDKIAPVTPRQGFPCQI